MRAHHPGQGRDGSVRQVLTVGCAWCAADSLCGWFREQQWILRTRQLTKPLPNPILGICTITGFCRRCAPPAATHGTCADKERQLQYESLFRDVATLVAEKCVNPDTQRPYTVSIIERALREAHFAVLPTKSAKQQALKAIAVLREHLPIERAKMRLRLTVPDSGG